MYDLDLLALPTVDLQLSACTLGANLMQVTVMTVLRSLDLLVGLM